MLIHKSEPNSRPLRLRRALLGLSETVAEEKVPSEVTIENVKSKWPQLFDSGYEIITVRNLANSEGIDEQPFVKIMQSLNSSL